MKIKTLVRTWSGNLLFAHDAEGPSVDFDEDTVSWVESCVDGCVPDDKLTVYLYRKGSLPTLTVRYLDLMEVSPNLARKAKESMHHKAGSPDPLRGSCT